VQGLARAERHLDAHPDDARALYLAAVTYAELGRADEARRAAERALQLEPDDSIVAYNLSCMYAALGEPDTAVDLLERGAAAGGVDYAWLEHDASLDPLRGHPRFEALRARLSAQAAPATAS
jgi:Flp pilus assembly protein TadD